jgi:hypothetical protein
MPHCCLSHIWAFVHLVFTIFFSLCLTNLVHPLKPNSEDTLFNKYFLSLDYGFGPTLWCANTALFHSA